MRRSSVSQRHVVLATVVILACAGSVGAADQATPQVLTFYPHDPGAFTQGFLLYDGFFFESTGLYGSSSVRRVDPLTGVVLQQRDLSSSEFGEGLARVDQRLIQITWRENVAYVYDLESFARIDSYGYLGEGWGLCYDGERLVMTDGGSALIFRDPYTFDEISRLNVTLDGSPINRLNELACVGHLVYSNVWLTDTILRIDPETGIVLTEIDASGLLTPAEQADANVLNGIAFDPATEHFFLTGKLWPKVFEVAFEFDPYKNGPCLVAKLSEVEGFTLQKDGTGGVTFSWEPDPIAARYHVNSVVMVEDLAPPGPHRPEMPGGQGVPACDGLRPGVGCNDPDALLDMEPLLFYQVFSACGPSGLEEGPP